MKHKDKIKYKGSFNWQGEMITLYRYAIDEPRALILFCRAISEMVGYNFRYVYGYFLKGNDCWRIEKA